MEDQMHIAATYDEFVARLKEHETSTRSRFIFLKSSKPKTLDVKVALSMTNLRLHWQGNLPYLNLGSSFYACHQGKDYNTYNKKKYAEKRDSTTKCYKKSLTTKKLNCPAKIIATRVLRFMNHELTGKITKRKKLACSMAIKSELEKNHDFGEECYIFNLPAKNDHNHLMIGDVMKLNMDTDKNLDETALISTFPSISKNEPSISTNKSIISTNESSTNYCELPCRGSNKRLLINKMNCTIRSIQSVMWNVGETELDETNISLKYLLANMTSKVSRDKSSDLPIPRNSTSDISAERGKLTLLRKRDHSGRVGMVSDMFKEARILQQTQEGYVVVKRLKIKK